MIRIQETTRTIPYYAPVPLTDLPLLYQREHVFPYVSYGDTPETSVPREFRIVVLENEMLRVEVTPELGGRVYSLFDKRVGKEVLFSNPVAAAKLDELYEALGETGKRGPLLARAPEHRRIVERRANLALVTGHPEETLRLLSTTPWPLEHQRYVRTELWKKACEEMGRDAEPIPELLHEDRLAEFGAYWSE